MSMNESHRKLIKRLMLEGVAIVLSILTAFGIDAVWDERVERIHEH